MSEPAAKNPPGTSRADVDARLAEEMTEEQIVELYAHADELEQRAKEMKRTARTAALHMYQRDGLAALQGDKGTMIVSETRGARRFSKDRARMYLTSEQWDACHEQGEPTTRVQFQRRRHPDG